MVLLTINISAIRLSMRSFMFWFKMYLVIKGTVCWCLLIFEFDHKPESTQLSLVNMFMLVFIMSVVDGILESKKVNICLSTIIFIYFSIIAYVHMRKRPMQDNTMLSIFGIYTTSIYDQMLDSEYTLCIFMFKQTVAQMLRNNKCVNIVQRPYIKWV